MGNTSPGTIGGNSNSTNLTEITQPTFSSPNHNHSNGGYAELAIANNNDEGGTFIFSQPSVSSWSATGKLTIGGASSSWQSNPGNDSYGMSLGGSTGYTAVTINRDTDVAIVLPNYLTCKYIIRVK